MGGEVGYGSCWVAFVVVVRDGRDKETNIYFSMQRGVLYILWGCQVRHRLILRDMGSLGLGGYMASKEKRLWEDGMTQRQHLRRAKLWKSALQHSHDI